MKVILTFLLLGYCFYTNGQAIQQISNYNTALKPNSESTKLMTERIREAAVQNQESAPVPMLAVFDLTFAAGLNEFKELNTFGILYIASMNQDKNENPIKRVYFKTKNDEAELPLLSSIPIPVTDTIIKPIYGETRVDYYFFIPYFYTQLTGEIRIDWTTNNKDFVLCQFPQLIKLSYLNNKSIYPDNSKILDPKALSIFMSREFQITMSPQVNGYKQ